MRSKRFYLGWSIVYTFEKLAKMRIFYRFFYEKKGSDIMNEFVLLPCKMFAKLYQLAAVGMLAGGVVVLYGAYKVKNEITRSIFSKKGS